MSNIGNKNDEYQNLSKIDWNVINTYFNSFKYYITKHHLDSYNNFISSTIPSIIKNLNPMKTLKTDTEKRLKHEIKTYIGGKNGDQIFLSKPYLFDENKTRVLYPNEARLKDLNYVADLRVNIYIEYLYYNSKGDVQEKKVEFNNIKIGVIPIMLHSNICVLNNQEQLVLKEMGECPFDQGGYFIISGKEKVLISQERNTTNRLYITESKDDKYSLEANMMCTSDVDPFPKTVKLYIFDEQYKINKEVTKLDKILDNIINKRNNAIIVDCFHIDDKIPLFILFRALGIESDKNILEYIVGDLDDPNNKPLIDFLRYSIIDGNFLHTQEQCLKYLSHYVQYNHVDEVRYILANDFLQNIGYNLKSKALYLGFLVNKLIKTKLGIITLTNRDNYIHKRIDTSGFLLGKLFRDFFNDFRNDAVRKIDSIYHYQLFGEKESVTDNLINKSNIKYIFNQDHIENGLIKSLKGQWGRLAKPSDSGISQDLGRLSYLEYVSHTRRVSNPLDTSVVKISEPRQLSGSQIGYMCPIESPDGGNIGLLKHMSVLCNISTEVNPKIIESKLNEFEDVKLLKDIEAINIKNYTKIFINNNWYGVITKDPRSIYKKFKEYRINKEINFDISITWDIKENELKFLCDSGRCIRPLYIVKKNKVLIDEHSSHINFNTIKWENLNQFIEYIDVEECNTRLIAMDRLKLDNSLQPYTNCEIHPSTILSIYTNTIPFCNRNQLPRNVFSGQQGKQAIGIYATNFNSRIDTRSYVLHYPQRALVHSKYTKFSHNDELPNGENVIVAIMTYTGYNQEDSIIINKSSIQRGMFNITAFKSVIDEEIENENAGEKIEFANPINMTKNGINIDIPWANWENIDEFGFPNENTYMRENDIIIGKIRVSTNKNGDKTYTNKSIPATNIINGTIDRKFIYKKSDGLKKIKIRMRKFKIPDLGDKLASRNGQKGVCGMIYNQENMPYTKDGIIPDLIINPHAIPSRMTIAHLVECVLGKLCCLKGVSIDATAFESHDIDKYYNILSDEFKYNKYGNEFLYNGFTGEQMPAEIFIGPTYYYRLKHMVYDKINSRYGKVYTNHSKKPEKQNLGYDRLTEQPVQGRARGGGLRVGEMESNGLLAHGISGFIRESLMERSDMKLFDINEDTGHLGYYDNELKTPLSTENINNMETNNYIKNSMPYAYKLLTQELEGLGISTQFITKDVDNELNNDDEFVGEIPESDDEEGVEEKKEDNEE
jgi:DNA-directed RNA polymerase II subunit RPB2